jgi:hypothetical protein
MVVNDSVHGRMKTSKARRILEELREEKEESPVSEHITKRLGR